MSGVPDYGRDGDALRRANDSRSDRKVAEAVIRGFASKCPNCGEGKLFSGFLKSVERCEACGQEIHHHRADDLPPYLTIFVVGHIMVALFMAVEATITLSLFAHLAIWVPLTIVLSLVLMQPLKGATIGLQWALKMGGFGGSPDEFAG